MKTYKVTHACPVLVSGEPCEADVCIEYEVFRGPDEFWPVDDTYDCASGHQVPQATLDTWYTEDSKEYGVTLYEQYDLMRYYHEGGERS